MSYARLPNLYLRVKGDLTRWGLEKGQIIKAVWVGEVVAEIKLPNGTKLTIGRDHWEPISPLEALAEAAE